VRTTIILDTNVLISALMSPLSTSRQAVVAAFRDFQPIWSRETWDELEEVSGRRKFARWYSEEERLSFLVMLAQSLRMETVTEHISDCADPKDNKFLELAVSTNTKVIVSGDVDLLQMHPYQGIAIIPPRLFLDSLAP